MSLPFWIKRVPKNNKGSVKKMFVILVMISNYSGIAHHSVSSRYVYKEKTV